MIGYKLAKSNKKCVLLTLEIDESNLIDKHGIIVKKTAIYYCYKAKVIDIEDKFGNKYDKATILPLTFKNLLFPPSILFELNKDVNYDDLYFYLDKNIALDECSEQMNGYTVIYYPNGLKFKECTYVNGILDGQYTEWYDNGTIRIKCNYINFKLDGEYIVKNKNGNIQTKRLYLNGSKL